MYMEKIQSIAVYCGARAGNNAAYRRVAEELGRELALRKIRLVYGGGGTGVMGTLSDSVLDNGGQVTGVIPRFLDSHEIAHAGLTELIRVDSMHIRKQTMFDRADAFIILPGGIGTLDEFFEIITWKQLKQHNKPVILVNVSGCWDSINTLIEDLVKNDFLHSNIREIFSVADNISDVFSIFD